MEGFEITPAWSGVSETGSLPDARVDDSCRGGDIDLYVEVPCDADTVIDREAGLHGFLQRRMGEQRIDIVTRALSTPPRPIDDEARRTGIRL